MTVGHGDLRVAVPPGRRGHHRRATVPVYVFRTGTGQLRHRRCGPGHISGYLNGLGASVVGIDLSPGMIAQARACYPSLQFEVGSLLALPADAAAWDGAVCAYSLIHLTNGERSTAYAELARVIRPGGWLLVAFHVSDPDRPAGGTAHVHEWWGQPVNLDFHFLGPDAVANGLADAGWIPWMRTLREPPPGVEHPSQRAYLLARLP